MVKDDITCQAQRIKIPLQLTCLKWCNINARQVAIHSGVHAGNMGLNVPMNVDTALRCATVLTVCWMIATKTYMMTRSK